MPATLYAAYGSNMNSAQMKKRCPQAVAAGCGIVEDYRLTLRGIGRGYANVEPCPKSSVPVVLWEITAACEQSLDRYEDYPYMYTKTIVTIKTSQGLLQGMMYVMTEEFSASLAPAAASYIQGIRQGLIEHGLPDAGLAEACREAKMAMAGLTERPYSAETVVSAFYRQSQPVQAAEMSAYMKGQFPFLGLPKPLRVLLQADFVRRTAQTGRFDWGTVHRLWQLPEREFQYLALEHLAAGFNGAVPGDLPQLAQLIGDKSWWDTVDTLAVLVGHLCRRYPELIAEGPLQWLDSGNIWLIRVSILFQLKYKKDTDTRLLETIISRSSGTKEFFINKAIGWALREYSKTDREWVRDFIGKTSLPALSVREGSKYL